MMANGRGEARRRRWADIVLIVAGVYAFLMAVFAPALLAPRQVAATVRWPGWLWAGTAVAGILALAAVFLALRSTVVARALSAAAGLILLLTLFALREIGWLAWVALIAPGAALLLATPFIGPMPTPEEEGKHR